MSEFSNEDDRKERYRDAWKRRGDPSLYAVGLEKISLEEAMGARDDENTRKTELAISVRIQWPELTEESIERAIGSIENRRVLILKDGKWMQAS